MVTFHNKKRVISVLIVIVVLFSIVGVYSYSNLNIENKTRNQNETHTIPPLPSLNETDEPLDETDSIPQNETITIPLNKTEPTPPMVYESPETDLAGGFVNTFVIYEWTLKPEYFQNVTFMSDYESFLKTGYYYFSDVHKNAPVIYKYKLNDETGQTVAVYTQLTQNRDHLQFEIDKMTAEFEYKLSVVSTSWSKSATDIKIRIGGNAFQGRVNWNDPLF